MAIAIERHLGISAEELLIQQARYDLLLARMEQRRG
jgi:plasmid maintenance system antidote protein VapI